MLDRKMDNAGMSNAGAFIRKMVFSGYILKIDFEPINQLVSLTSSLSNHLNQLARKANSYEAISDGDMEALRKVTEDIHDTNKLLLDKIGKL